MADSKLTALAALVALTGDELLYIVEDPSGTPLDRKITVTNLLAEVQPLEAELTALAALTTTAYGRALLELSGAAAGLTALAVPQYAPLDFPATCDPGGHSVATTAFANGLGWWGRVTGKPLTITKLAVSIGTSSGNLSVAVYANTGSGVASRPGTRKGTSGAVASPGTGYREIALTAAVDVVPGDWFAVSADNATITFRMTPSANGYAVDDNLVAWRGGYNLAAHPLPNPGPTIVGSGSIPIILGIA